MPADFLRPYLGYGTSRSAQHTGNATYNSLQVQLNRRYIKGLQFALAYTLAKADSRGTEHRSADLQPLKPGRPERGAVRSTQLHNLTVSYTWDVPDGSRMWNNAADPRPARRLAALRQHRVRQRRLGGRDVHRPPTTSTSRAGIGGTRPTHHRRPAVHGGNCDPKPGGTGSYFNLAAFSRPTGRGDIGNAPARVLPAAVDREHRTLDVQELRHRRASGCSSGGRSTTCSTR